MSNLIIATVQCSCCLMFYLFRSAFDDKSAFLPIPPLEQSLHSFPLRCNPSSAPPVTPSQPFPAPPPRIHDFNVKTPPTTSPRDVIEFPNTSRDVICTGTFSAESQGGTSTGVAGFGACPHGVEGGTGDTSSTGIGPKERTLTSSRSWTGGDEGERVIVPAGRPRIYLFIILNTWYYI